MRDEFACLRCPLSDCDESSPLCLIPREVVVKERSASLQRARYDKRKAADPERERLRAQANNAKRKAIDPTYWRDWQRRKKLKEMQTI